MLWYCVLMCCIQHGDEVPYRLADGELVTFPKRGGSCPDYMRFTNSLGSSLHTGSPPAWTQTGTGSLVTVGRGVSGCLAIR